MTGSLQVALIAGLAIALGGCLSTPAPAPQSSSRPVARPVDRPGPAQPAFASPPVQTPASPGFIAPQIMRLPGLENVIGRDAAHLQRQFGKARLDVAEGDSRKLQFLGEACVLDIYLYPLRPDTPPVATHVEARRASDGRDVDRAQCVAALGGLKR